MSAPLASALPPHFPREISREEMAALPIRRYAGEVPSVTMRPAAARCA